MIIFVNNHKVDVPENFLIINLLDKLNYSKHVAVWVNDVQLLQQEYSKYVLKNNDNVRIIKPFGGG